MDILKRTLTYSALALLLASLIISSFSASARSGVGRASQGDPLCNSPQMTGARLAGCRAILAQLTEPSSCTKPILDRIAAASAAGRFNGMGAFCPNYKQFNGDSHARALIWRNMIAALVTEESSWNPRTSGDGGRSRGLLQFGYGNAGMKPYKCACDAARRDIENPAANARCGTHIYLYNVARDMNTGGGPAGRPGAYGAARFFGPYGDGQRNKRNRMAAKVNAYCRSLPAPAPRAPTPPPPTPAPNRGTPLIISANPPREEAPSTASVAISERGSGVPLIPPTPAPARGDAYSSSIFFKF